jgi:Raf kinase inhibitor-like YbhB/YbcL family protein
VCGIALLNKLAEAAKEVFPMRAYPVVFASVSLLLSGCTDKSSTFKLDQGAPTMQLTTSAFKQGETIPKKYTADGTDVSPPLRWEGAPKEAKSYALICDDPDAPRGTWTHWVIYNLPADITALEEGVAKDEKLPNGARQGTNSWGKGNIGYRGPDPPAGKPHRYFFKVYALDSVLDQAPGASKDQLEKAMKGHVLAHGELMGTYGR